MGNFELGPFYNFKRFNQPDYEMADPSILLRSWIVFQNRNGTYIDFKFKRIIRLYQAPVPMYHTIPVPQLHF